MRAFESLSERQILALAIASGEEDPVQVMIGGTLVFLAGMLIGTS